MGSNNIIISDHTKPNSLTMEDEEDDLYGSAAPEASEQAPANGDAQVKSEQIDASEGSDEDSDDVRNRLHIHSMRYQSNQFSPYRTFKLQQSDQKAQKPSRCMYRDTTNAHFDLTNPTYHLAQHP